MKANDWEKIKDVFAQVLEQPDARRADFLGAACAGDGVLRAEIESLLKAYDETKPFIERDDFVASSLLFANEDEDADFYAGKQFGRYRIVKEIGRGGMGAVFLAERSDGEFAQRVALKIVRRSFADRELGKLFRRERQILASLNHPNIAKLLDGGVSSDGEPYLAMEYVEGMRIDDFCRSENLSTRERLKLFLAVCRAVAFAHQNLIVHRDLKPSNILVTGDGNVKLLDFGIAKLIEPETANEQTRTAFRAFTPEYAAPEQIAGERVTTAADVFSLGVLLEELLRGANRSAGKWQSRKIENGANKNTVAVNLQTNRETENSKSANQNLKPLDGELKNICAMARRDEPSRRYASVEQLGEDVERYLDGLPVRARQNSFRYRAEKFVARNRASVSAFAFVFLALVAGFGAALWQARVARGERDRAEKRFAEVRELSNALLSDIAPKIERLPGAIEARGALVSQSLKYLDNLASEERDDLQLQSELAAAYEKIGDLQGNPSNPNYVELGEAIKSYEKANEIRQEIQEKSPNDAEANQKLAENYRVLGNIYSQANEAEASAKNTNAALQIYETLNAEKSSSEARLNLAKTNYDAGLNLQTSKKWNDSLVYFERAKNLLEPLRRETPDNVRITEMLGECAAQNAVALSWTKKQPEAEAEINRAIAVYEPLLARNENDASARGGMWLVYWLASSVYQDQNDRLAYEYALKAVNVARETAAKDAANIRAKQQLAKSFSTLGECATTIKKPIEAIEYLNSACRIQREITDGTARNTRLKSELALSLMRLGAAQTERGFLTGALENLRQSEETYRAILEAAPDDRRSNRNLAATFEQIAKTNEKLFQTEKSENFRQAAKTNYRNALDVLLKLEARGALAEADRKFLDEIKTAAAKL
jgi:serine/threonine protein kinase